MSSPSPTNTSTTSASQGLSSASSNGSPSLGKPADRAMSFESEGSGVDTWTFPIESIDSRSAQYFKNFLRYSSDRGIITREQLAALVSTFENFADDDTKSVSVDIVSTESEDDSFASDTDLHRSDSVSQSLSTNSHRSSISLDPLLDPNFLAVVEAAMENAVSGVRVGRRRQFLKNYHNVFVAKEAVDWMIERSFAESREAGVRLGQALALKGFIAAIKGEMFADDTLFFRFTKHPQSFPLKAPPTSACSSCHNNILELIYHVHGNSVNTWLDRALGDVMLNVYPTVLLWSVQNPDLNTEVALRLLRLSENHPALRMGIFGFTYANGECLGKKFNVKPTDAEMATFKMISKQPPSDDVLRYQDQFVPVVHPLTHEKCFVELKKEFVSSAKPVWIKFRKAEDPSQYAAPDMIGKYGDDLRKDLCVQIIFNACEAIWAASGQSWLLGKTPSVRSTKVLVTGATSGFIEFVKGRTVKEVAADHGWKKVNLHALAPTIVGSMVSGFVLGVRDRHSENWMLLNEDSPNPSLMQIDFGYMLMENPGGLPLDTPRLTMDAELVTLLEKTPSQSGNAKRSLMDDLRADMITAYKVLRMHHPALVSFAKVTLSSLYTENQVESFMWGKHCFRSGQAEHSALAWFEDKVRSQLTTRVLRRSAKHALVKAYYSVKSTVSSMEKNMKSLSNMINQPDSVPNKSPRPSSLALPDMHHEAHATAPSASVSTSSLTPLSPQPSSEYLETEL